MLSSGRKSTELLICKLKRQSSGRLTADTVSERAERTVNKLQSANLASKYESGTFQSHSWL